jgi:MarR family 2-MHQ and catechol resistance regulon transcriptional repressor
VPTRYPGTAAQQRALNAYIKFMRASETIRTMASREIRDYGLTASQFAVMEALYWLGDLTFGELGQKVLMSGGNLTVVADNLERDGFVSRCRSTEDRRSIRVALTAAGRKRIGAVMERHVGFLVQAMSALNGAEQSTLETLCRKLGTTQDPDNRADTTAKSRKRLNP